MPAFGRRIGGGVMCRADLVAVATTALAMLCVGPSQAAAQSADELAKQTQNPIASLISVPFQGNWDFGLGDRDAIGTLLNVQPVVPFGDQHEHERGPARHHAADVSATIRVRRRAHQRHGRRPGDGVLLARRRPGASSGAPVRSFLLPAATDNALGTEKFGIGPLGSRADAAWQVDARQRCSTTSGRRAAPTTATDVNQTYLQPFANYNLGGGLAVGVSVEASANWSADDTWTAPMLFSVSKVTLLGKRPVNLAMAAGPVLASADAAASWRFRLAATFLFPR